VFLVTTVMTKILYNQIDEALNSCRSNANIFGGTYKNIPQGLGGCKGMGVKPHKDQNDKSNPKCKEESMQCINRNCKCVCNDNESCPLGFACNLENKECQQSCNYDHSKSFDENQKKSTCKDTSENCAPNGLCTSLCKSDKDCSENSKCKSISKKFCPPNKPVNDEEKEKQKNSLIENLNKQYDEIINDPDNTGYVHVNYIKLILEKYTLDSFVSLGIFKNDKGDILKDGKQIDYDIEKIDSVNIKSDFDFSLGKEKLFNDPERNRNDKLQIELTKLYLSYIFVLNDKQKEKINKSANVKEKVINIKFILEYSDSNIEKFSEIERIGKCYKWKQCVNGEKCKVKPFGIIPLIGNAIELPCILEESSPLVNGLIYAGILIILLVILFFVMRKIGLR